MVIRTKECIVVSKHELHPEDFLHFVELDEFHDDWRELGLSDDDLVRLQISIMLDPKGPPVMKRTGGLRKLRFAPPGWRGGKSGAVRVGYVYFEEHWMVLLVLAYGKNVKDDLSEEERQGIKTYIEQSKRWLDNRNY